MNDRRERPMLRYKAGYKYVNGGVHAQVLDFPAAITWAGDLEEARRLLGIALVDVADGRRFPNRDLPYPRTGRTRLSSTRRWTSRSRSTCTCEPAQACGKCRHVRCREAPGPDPTPADARLSSPARGSVAGTDIVITAVDMSDAQVPCRGTARSGTHRFRLASHRVAVIRLIKLRSVLSSGPRHPLCERVFAGFFWGESLRYRSRFVEPFDLYQGPHGAIAGEPP